MFCNSRFLGMWLSVSPLRSSSSLPHISETCQYIPSRFSYPETGILKRTSDHKYSFSRTLRRHEGCNCRNCTVFYYCCFVISLDNFKQFLFGADSCGSVSFMLFLWKYMRAFSVQHEAFSVNHRVFSVHHRVSSVNPRVFSEG